MRQTAAIFLDAYRELNARKMFWITMMLSGLFVLGFAAIGNNDRGFTILHWTIEFPPLSTKVISHADFYKTWFVSLGLKMWLGWIASILALISTASMIPDFLAGGAIELSLSKPIGRVRLFLTKYAAGLLFVAMQVTVFTTACFLVIGLRGGVWEPMLFLSVPMTVLVFSFLFSICALAGVITRSTIAALLITLLSWFVIFLVNSSESVLLLVRTQSEVRLEKRLSTIESLSKDIAKLEAEGVVAIQKEAPAPDAKADEPKAEDPKQDEAKAETTSVGVDPSTELTKKRERVADLTSKLDENRKTAKLLSQVHTGIFITKTILPKTQESLGLLTRWLVSEADLDRLGEAGADHNDEQRKKFRRGGDPIELAVERESESRLRKSEQQRSVGWVLGTSVAFEAVMLGLAALLFARRDF